MELTQLREKLNEAKELYSKVFEIEEEVRVMIEEEVKKHKPEFEFYTEYVTDYFDFVMNDHVDIAEMMIMRDILNEKIDAFMKN